METLSEHMKKSNQDRISSLPPELQCKILSFLDTREAVRTCILSPKWRQIWTFVPFICLHQTAIDEENFEAFERFGDNLLHHLKTTCLDTFKLTSLNWYHPGLPPASRWIAHAVKLNPRVIYLHLHVQQDMHFPDCIFVCGTLEELTCMICPTPKLVDLPRLKILKISNSAFSDDFMSKHNSGCPVLEDLTLENCGGPSLVSSSTLHKLTIDSFWERSKGIDISIPTLAFLRLGGSVPGQVHSMNLPSLVCATARYFRFEGDFGLVKFLGGLVNVRHLSLYGGIVEDLSESELNECPTFLNLKSLSVGECICHNNFIPTLASFLEHLPNLEKLMLENILWDDEILFHFEHSKDVQIGGHKSKAGKFIKTLLMNPGNPANITTKISW